MRDTAEIAGKRLIAHRLGEGWPSFNLYRVVSDRYQLSGISLSLTLAVRDTGLSVGTFWPPGQNVG